jgi:hypothetical protein
MEAPQPMSEASPAGDAEGASAASQGDPGPEEMDARIAASFRGDATADAVAILLVDVSAAAKAADGDASAARQRSLDPLLARDEVAVARRQSEDAGFARDRLTEAAKKLAERLVELRAAEKAQAMRADHEKCEAERDRLAMELERFGRRSIGTGDAGGADRKLRPPDQAHQSNFGASPRLYPPRAFGGSARYRVGVSGRGCDRRLRCGGCGPVAAIAAAAVIAIGEATSGLKGSVERVILEGKVAAPDIDRVPPFLSIERFA